MVVLIESIFLGSFLANFFFFFKGLKLYINHIHISMIMSTWINNKTQVILHLSTIYSKRHHTNENTIQFLNIYKERYYATPYMKKPLSGVQSWSDRLSTLINDKLK